MAEREARESIFQKVGNLFSRNNVTNATSQRRVNAMSQRRVNNEDSPAKGVRANSFTRGGSATDYDGSDGWLKTSRKRPLLNNTSSVQIEKEHLYRGYGYGIIRSVVNTGILTAEENIRTTCSSTQREILAASDEQIEHPYKKLWQNSPYFSEYDFWKNYLTYIQLKGEFYIYMTREPRTQRGRVKNLMSPTAYMKIINPYEMKPFKFDKDGNVEVWRQTIPRPEAKSLVKDIPAYQIIRVSELNPWRERAPFSLLDATKENLFTLENAKDFTRHALVNNVNTPGLLAVEGEFATQEDFDNYISILKNHDEGEVIVAAGTAKTTFQSMDQNLDGASQEKIRQIERDEMLVSAGVSKSILGIETTGLTRDVAATQKLTFIEKTVVPYIRLMIETLNYDYRVNYARDFAVDKYILHVTVPSIGDKAQEMKELEIREEEYNMVQRYVDRGYTRKSAAQYVRGEIDVEQLQLENGDRAKMSPQESVELVDATERWEALIAAGNDPQSVIDYIEGRISLAEFIEINKDAALALRTTTTPADDPESDGDKKEPADYYDPDPDDYSTPRDEKETPADKKDREDRNAIAVEVIMDQLKIGHEEAEKKLASGDLDRNLRCRIQDRLQES